MFFQESSSARSGNFANEVHNSRSLFLTNHQVLRVRTSLQSLWRPGWVLCTRSPHWQFFRRPAANTHPSFCFFSLVQIKKEGWVHPSPPGHRDFQGLWLADAGRPEQRPEQRFNESESKNVFRFVRQYIIISYKKELQSHNEHTFSKIWSFSPP